VPGFAVDRHVLRVANRIGLAQSDDPERVEQQLTGSLASLWWTRASDTLFLHGRRICKPTPVCERCAVNDLCAYRRASGRPATKVTRRRTKPRRTDRAR
jgi:endonuclease III